MGRRPLRCLSGLFVVAVIVWLAGCARWHVDVDQADARISYATHEETEPAVALHPGNQNRIVVAIIGMGQYSQDDGNFINRGCRISQSTDGGLNWQKFLIEADDYDREEFSDPAVAIDDRGVSYITGFFHDRSNAGTISRIRPMLARIDANGGNQADVIIFDDGAPRRFDKPFIAAGQHEGQTRLYIAYTSVHATVDHERQIRVIVIDDPDSLFEQTRSDDIELESTVLAQGNNWGAHPAVGPDGEVYVVWTGFAPPLSASPTNFQIRYVKRKPDRQRWSEPKLLAELGPGQVVNGVMRYPRSPAVAISPEQVTRGWVYVTFADQAPLYTPVTLPNAARINATGINPQGDVVGWYQDRRTDRVVGFRRRRTESYDVFEYPGAASTVASGVNGRRVVTGTFTEPSGGQRGFIWNGNQFTLVSYPGSLETHAQDINNEGRVTGWFVSEDLQAHGFLREADGVFVALDHPAGRHTFSTGINNAGTIVGHYVDDAERTHGFRYQSGTWSPIEIANAVAVQPADINEQADIVGSYSDAQGNSHGFVIAAEALTRLSYPGASDLYLTGINNAREISGYTLSDNEPRPFVMTGFGAEDLLDIWMLRSANGGETWHLPVRVNDVTHGDQFFPWLCAAGDGSVYLAWLDRRDDPDNLRYHVYATATLLGSLSFLDEIRVTRASSNPKMARLKEGGRGFIGDYIGMACGMDRAFPVWPDLRNAPPQDIFAARLRVVDP